MIDNDIKNAIEKFSTESSCGEDISYSICSSTCLSTCEVTCQTTCQLACQTTCLKSCQTTCQKSCQTTCQKTCQTTCQKACQSTCELDCMTTCETSCQTTCEKSCQSTCQKACQSVCELGCQCTAQGCETCQSTCEKSCQCTVEGCQTCQTKCQNACQAVCELGCQCTAQGCETCQDICELSCQNCLGACETKCQKACQTACETDCMSTCEVNCENCLGACETVCETGCEAICQRICQNSCELSCQTTCQTSCQTTCELSCQSTCELSCQTTCQKSCQATCELSCQNCLGLCETTCEKGCETACELSCQNCLGACETACEIDCQTGCETSCQSMSENASPTYETEAIHYGTAGINPGTGNYSETFIDMSIDSPGFKLNISRTYNSKDDRLNKPFGRGWTFGFEGYVQGDASVSVRLPNGGSFMFAKNADGTYTPVDSRNKLEKAADGTYTLTTKDQYKYKFNSAGYLAAMIDKNNNTITIAADSSGKITAISDAAAQHYTVVYNTDGLIDTITEQTTQRRIKYEYQNKLLTKVTDPMDYYVTYTYDSYNYLTEIKDMNGNLEDKMEYDHINADNLHKLTKLTDSFGNIKGYIYDASAHQTTITDTNNRIIITWYDSSNYVTKTQDPEGKIVTTEYYLENNENKYGEEKSHTDRYGNKTEYIRDAVGNITKTINPDTSFEEYQYDDKNNKIYEKDEMSNITYYIYDSQKISLIKKVQPLNGTDSYSETADQSLFAITRYEYYTDAEAQQLSYKALGLLKTITTPEGNITTYTYDAEGNVKTVTDPETLKTTTYEYNSIGLKTAEISAKGYRVEFEYNKNMQLHKKILKSANNETIIAIYDYRGRKIKEISPNEYNPLDDLDENSYNGDYGHRYEYLNTNLLWKVTDSLNNTTEYSYDLYGNKKSEIRPDGGIYEYEYDVLNRVKKVMYKENSTAESVLLEEYFYEVLPDKKSQTTHRIYFTGSEYVDTKYIYDYAGRLVSTINPDGTTLLTNYNPNGTINNTVDEKGKTTYYKYDGLNRLTEKWVPVDEVSGLTSYAYYITEYDKDGNKKAEKTSPDKVDLYAVPVNPLIISYEYYKNNKLKKASDTAGRITEYWYDDDINVSRIESKTDELNKQITAYDNNYLGLVSTKTVYVKTGDIYGNDFENTQAMGLVTRYTYDKSGNLITETSPDNIITTYVYDSMNRKIEKSEPGIDENGTAVSIVSKTSYNFEGKVLSTTDANNNMTTFVYNKRGFLEKVIYPSPDGGTALFAYDLAGRKTDEVMPNSFDDVKTIQQMNRTVYAYDNMGRQITKMEIFDEKIYNPADSTWSSTPAAKVSKAFKYDEKGQVIKELDAEGYSTAAGTTVQEKINNGYGVEYKYTLAGKVAEVLDAVLKDKGLAYTIKNEYDAIGRKTKGTDSLGRIKNLYYDAVGNLTAVKHQDTSESSEIILESKSYNLHGNVLTATDGNGNTVTFEYNELNKLRRETHPSDETIEAYVITYQYDVTGNLKSKVDSLLKQELYTYDNEGRVLTKTDQKSDGTEAVTVSIKYDKAGNPRYEIDGSGNVIEKTYDSLNRAKTVNIKVKDVNNVETTHTTTFAYDKNGNKTGETDWRGNVVTFVYDGINRLIEKIDPYLKSVEKKEYNKNDTQIKAYDALNNVTIFEYDKNKRLLKTTDPELHATSQSFDDAGNIKTKTDGRGNVTTYNYDGLNRLLSVLNAKGETTSYSYDAAGNVLIETDGRGNTTTFEYGVKNQIIRKIDHGGRSGEPGTYTYTDAKVESYTYFEDGKAKTVKDRNGVITSFTYDIHGILKTKSAGLTSISNTYDSNGNILTITDATGVTERKYDSLNRVTEKIYPNIGKTVYSYDIITGVDAGETAETTTDPKGNINLKVYDRVDRIKSVTSENRTTIYEYYNNGNKKSVQYQDGSRTDYTYYKDSLLNTLVSKKTDGTVFESYSYNYDAAHNQTSKVDKKGTTNYTYDALNRLETIAEPSGRVTAYEFDASGNRSKQTVTENTTVTTTIYTYNEQNRLISSDTTGGKTENISFAYDNNGNLLSEVNGTNTTTHVYDEFNQLRETLKDSNTIRAKYNGEGKRVEREINGAVTRFLYEGNNIILEVNAAGDELARNIYGANLAQRKVTGTILSYFYNGQGDVTALVNSAGSVVATYYYDAFGNHIETTGAADNTIRYRGYQYDGETGLYYLMSRMYCPVTARFLQEDSYRGDRQDPLSLNLYTYCHNEPIMYVDLDGHRAYSNTYDPEAPDPKKIAPPKPSKPTTPTKLKPAPKPSQPAKPAAPAQPSKASNDVGGSSSSNADKQRRNMNATSASSDERPNEGGSSTSNEIESNNSGSGRRRSGRQSNTDSEDRENYQGANIKSEPTILATNTGDKSVDIAYTKWWDTHPQLMYGDDLGYSAMTTAAFQNKLMYMSKHGTDVSKLSIDELNKLFKDEADFQAGATMALSSAAVSITKNVGAMAAQAGNLSFKTGKDGEKYLAKLVGGESQAYFKTSQGGRYIDQLAGGIAYESKVGYTSLTDFVKKQILKDAELINTSQINGAEWNFFRSGVTSKIGASKQLLKFLDQNKIKYIIHK